MPGKSQRGRKHLSRSKKEKSRRAFIAAQRQSAVAEAPKPVSRPIVSASPVTAPSPVAKVQYPYISGELRRIGILAGIILVILVVLTFVLS